MKVVAPPKADPQERLESWKEIASFLGKGIRTVQRWERTEDLPVRRHLHERGGTVYAYKTEILEWYRSRESRLTGAAERGAESATGPVPDRHRLYFIAAPVLAATVILAVLLWPRRLPFDGLTSPFLTVAGRASQSVISPDGSQVAFVWNAEREFGNLDLYMKGVAGGPPRRLTDDPNNEHSPAWSADGVPTGVPARQRRHLSLRAAAGRPASPVARAIAGGGIWCRTRLVGRRQAPVFL